MAECERSILILQNLDLASPQGCTVPYYLTEKLADSYTVHAICRRRPNRRDGGYDPNGFVLHDLDIGEVPVLSGLLFVVLSTLYAMVLGAVYRYDAVYAFQNEMIQGRVAAWVGGSRFVVGLQSVPVRQARDFARSNDRDHGVRNLVSMQLYSAYAVTVEYLLKSATDVVCLTEGIRDLTEDTYGVDLGDAHVIGMGIDVETFAPSDPEQRSSPPETWTLTYVGTVRETRGLNHVIEGLAATDHDVELRVAGDGPDRHVAALQQRAEELDIADRIDWLGLLPHEDIPNLLRSSDVAVSPLSDIESYRVSYPAKMLETRQPPEPDADTGDEECIDDHIALYRALSNGRLDD